MKRKKIFSGLVLFAMVMGITACAVGKDDTSEVQILQPEPISTEEGNDEQKETTFHNAQSSGTQGNKSQAAEAQQSEIQGSRQSEIQGSRQPEIQGSRQPEIQGSRQPETQESQQQVQNDADTEWEEKLAQYRAEREGMTNVVMGNGVSGYGAPNAENFGFQANTADYMQNFDSRELNKAYETAKLYVTETLAISVETNAVVYPCVDPRITEIYEAEDKGVAEGYDPKNIFVCEYCDNGTWQYLFLVRDGKDSDWSVIHHGDSYKE